MAKGKKKSKSDSITLEMPGTIGSAKLVFPETEVVTGSHLTITYNNGYPEKLEWDDEALLNDVRAAILKAGSDIPANDEDQSNKKATRTKKAALITASKKSK
jgi:hypothetical protein